MLTFTQWNNVVLPIEGGRSGPDIKGRSNLLPVKGGAVDLDGYEWFPQNARITWQADFTDEDQGDDLQTRLRALLKEFTRGRGVMFAQDRAGAYYVTWAKMVQATGLWTPGQLGMQPITVLFDQPYPYWLLLSDMPAFLFEGFLFSDGLEASGNYTQTDITDSDVNFTITNDGGAHVPRGEFFVRVNSGSVYKPAIVNNTNGLYIKYDGTLNAGDNLYINWLKKTILLNGASAWDDIEVAKEYRWMRLDLGDNEMTFDLQLASGSTTLWTVWARHYLG